MNSLINCRKLWRTALVFTLVLTMSASALPQHEGHDMKKMPAAKPKPRPTTRKRSTRPRRRTPALKAGGEMPSQSPMASPTPMPSPMQSGTPVPQGTPASGHGTHQMPVAQGTPTPVQDIVRPRREVIPAGPPLRLEDLEQ